MLMEEQERRYKQNSNRQHQTVTQPSRYRRLWSSVLLLVGLVLELGKCTLLQDATIRECTKLCETSIVPFVLPDNSNRWSSDYFSKCNSNCKFDKCCRVEQCKVGCLTFPLNQEGANQKSCSNDYPTDSIDHTVCTQGHSLARNCWIGTIYANLISDSINIHGSVNEPESELKMRFEIAADRFIRFRSLIKSSRLIVQRRQITDIDESINRSIGNLSTTWHNVGLVSMSAQGDTSVTERISMDTNDVRMGKYYQYRLVFVNSLLNVSLASHSHGVYIPWHTANQHTEFTFTTHQQLSGTQFVLCWKFMGTENVEGINVEVTLMRTVNGVMIRNQTISSSCITFVDLESDVDYEARVSIRGTVPLQTQKHQFKLKPIKESSGSGIIIFATPNNVWLVVGGPTSEYLTDKSDARKIYETPKQPFGVAPSITDITALATGDSSVIFVGTGGGVVHRQQLGPIKSDPVQLYPTRLQTNYRGPAILSLSADWLNEMLYIVHNDKITTCSYETCNNAPERFLPLGAKPKSIVVDPWNGYLYELSISTNLYRIPLAHLTNPTDSKHLTISDVELIKMPNVVPKAISLDLRLMQLMIATQRGQLWAYDLVTSELSDIRSDRRDVGLSGLYSQRNLVSFTINPSDSSLYFVQNPCLDVNGVEQSSACMYREEHILQQLNHNNQTIVRLNQYVLGLNEFNPPIAVAWLGTPPLFMPQPPQAVSLLPAVNSARATWSAPRAWPYQSSLPWSTKGYVYKATLFDAQTGKEVQQTTRATNVVFFNLTPNQPYTLKVAACLEPNQNSNGNRNGVTELCSENSRFVTANTFTQPINEFVVVDAHNNWYKLDSQGTVTSYDGIKPSLNRALTAVSSARLGRVFWSESNAVWSQSSPNQPAQIVINRPAKHLALNPTRAVLYISDGYHIEAYRITGSTIDKINTKFHACNAAIDVCQEITALTVKQSTDELLFMMMRGNTLEIWKQDAFGRQAKTILAQEPGLKLPDIKQLYHVGGKYIYLTSDGAVGTLDHDNLSRPPIYIRTKQPVVQLFPLGTPSIPGYLQSPQAIDIQFGYHNGELLIDWQSSEKKFTETEMLSVLEITDSQNRPVLSRRLLGTTHYVIPESAYVSLPAPNSLLTINVTTYTASSCTVGSVKRQSVLPPLPPRDFQIHHSKQQLADRKIDVIDLSWRPPLSVAGKVLKYEIHCLNQSTSEHSIREQILGTVDSTSVIRYRVEFEMKQHGVVTCELRSLYGNTQQTRASRWLTRAINEDSNQPLITVLTLDQTSGHPIGVLPALSRPGHVTAVRYDDATHALTLFTVIGSNIYGLDETSAHLVRIDLVNHQHPETHLLEPSVGLTDAIGLAPDWSGNSVFVVAKSSKSNKNYGLFRIPLPKIDKNQMSNSIFQPPIDVVDLGFQFDEYPPAEHTPFVIDPFKGNLFYHADFSKLITINLNQLQSNNKPSVFNLQSLSCLQDGSAIRPEILSAKFIGLARSPTLVLATGQTLVSVPAENLQQCDTLMSLDKAGLNTKANQLHSVALVDDQIFLMATNGSLIVYNSGRYNKTVDTGLVQLGSGQPLIAENPAFQPHEHITCLELPRKPSKPPTVAAYGRTGAIVTFPQPELPAACRSVLQPPIEHSVRFVPTQTGKQIHREYTYAQRERVVGQLVQHTRYQVYSTWRNLYTGDNVQSESPAATFTAGEGFPSAPRNPKVYVVTPSRMLLTWRTPLKDGGLNLDQIEYRVSNANSPHTEYDLDLVVCDAEQCSGQVGGLAPSTPYSLEILARKKGTATTASVDPEGTVKTERQQTLPSPGSLILQGNPDAYSVLLQWQPQVGVPLGNIRTPVVVETLNQANQHSNWESNGYIDSINTFQTLNITGLLAGTPYSIRYRMHYVHTQLIVNVPDSLVKSRDFVHTSLPIEVRTKSAPPQPPQNVRLVSKDGSTQLEWDQPSRDGGAPINGYAVWFRDSDSSQWQLLTDSVSSRDHFYKLSDSELSSEREFAVTASNQMGRSQLQRAEDDRSSSQALVAVLVIALLLILLIILIVCVVLFCVLRRKQSKKLGGTAMHSFHHPPIALHVPGDGSLKRQNVLELIPQEDIRSLPHVPRSCITVARQLGKGAFGEVYEGLACNLPRVGPKSVRVAIKTLRSGSRNEDRVKFLKEALLMNTFDHENVIRLLGVCLENEPHWLVLELMEGGDLLSFLRDSRPVEDMPSQVSVRDLMKIIDNVCAGCAYLEQQHHVHRDLAARNCLVSTRVNAETRTVKIADFGLARDVYEVDYYRVDGHGLLPIRWMAHESLIDGVFTVMTLGQQPYHGQTNFDVLNFVRRGGRLQKPEFCPQPIYDQMRCCWSERAEDRPNFATLRVQLHRLQQHSELQSDVPYPPQPYHTSFPQHPTTSAASTALSDSRHGARHSGVSNPSFVRHPTDFDVTTPQSNPGSAEGNIRIFTTNRSAKFKRGEVSAQSMRDGDTKNVSNRQRRAFSFKSLRKEKKEPPPKLPSKEDLTQLERIQKRDSRTSTITDGTHRPMSTISSGGESYTTNRADYEAGLFKGRTNFQMTERGYGGSTNAAYSPTGTESDNYYCTSNSSRPAVSPVSEVSILPSPMDSSVDTTTHRYTPQQRPNSGYTKRARRPAPTVPPPPVPPSVSIRTPSTDYTDVDLTVDDRNSFELRASLNSDVVLPSGGGAHNQNQQNNNSFAMTIPISPTDETSAGRHSRSGLTSKPSEV